MKASRLKLPSIGFVCIVTVHALALAFFIWGISTPDLDRVWTLHHELKIGEMKKLDLSDARLLRKAMARHTNLARALLDEREIGIISSHSAGWIDAPNATILRTPASRRYRSLLLDVQTAEDLIPFNVVVAGSGWKLEREVSAHGLMEIALPAPLPDPEIITVTLTGRRFPSDPSALGLCVKFPAAKHTAMK